MKENEDLSKILSDINTMKEKINKLEKENNDMKELLSQVKEKGDKGDNNNSLKQEINDLKKLRDQFEASIIKEFSNFKNEMINDINAKLFKLFHNLKENNNTENLDIKLDYQEENNNEDDIRKNPKKEKEKYLKYDFVKDSVKSNFLTQKEELNYKNNNKIFEENINQKLFKYDQELNESNLKLSLLEKKYDSISTQYYSDLKNINNMIESMKKYQKNFDNFKENTIFNLNKFKGDFEHNVQNNKLFITEISSLIEEFQKKLNKYEKNNIRMNSNLSERKDDLDLILNNLNQTLNNEMNEFHLEINRQIKDQSNEIENFEKFISQEHEKFVDFIQNRLDESISSIKKLFDFNKNDIKRLNNKIEIVQENIKKVRTDVFQNINDSEEFLENKYQSLFRLFNN